MQNIKFFIILSIILIGAASCDKKDPVIPEEPELITTLIYTLTPAGGGDSIVFSFSDPDGDGGDDPVIVTNPLDSGVVYNGVILLLNESVDPVENISDEVEEEAEEHQFFFMIDQADMTVTYEDTDENGHPIGLQTLMSTGASSQGHMTIVLRHLPDKNASGVADGDITNAGGETDIEVTFPMLIK
jgi:hypothetical protein